jgi:N utilization substance protein A
MSDIVPTELNLIRDVLARHVPEIANGRVEVKAIARRKGWRTKVAVHSTNPEVDAVRACVGNEEDRIKSIVAELQSERLDIIRWDKDTRLLISNALRPAVVGEVRLASLLRRAVVLVHDEQQLSLAIGHEGANVQLASALCGWDIELLTPEELARVSMEAAAAFGALRGLDAGRRQRLVEAGFFRFQDVSRIRPGELAELLNIPSDQADGIIRQARAAGKPK